MKRLILVMFKQSNEQNPELSRCTQALHQQARNPVRYRGDEDLQALLFGADISGSINRRPCGAAAVQLKRKQENNFGSKCFSELIQIIANLNNFQNKIQHDQVQEKVYMLAAM